MSARQLTPLPERRIRALVHLLRTPLAAARLRVRLAGEERDCPTALADVEAALVTLDTAVARLLPLAAGDLPDLVPLPSDLVAIVLATMRSCGGATSLQTPATLPGRWDAFAVACIVRNLVSLTRDDPTRTALTLMKVRDGATLRLDGSAAPPPSGDARRWLIERLVQAHGGSASLAFERGRLKARVFLAGHDPPEGYP